MQALILTLTLLFTGGKAAPTEAVPLDDPTWSAYQKVLTFGVKEYKFSGTYGPFTHAAFDYKALKNNAPQQINLNTQITTLKSTTAPTDRFGKLAFWMNAYNFFTLVDINNNYPTKSMKDIGWKKKHHNVNGKLYSLDEIEHKIIRPLDDPRIHFSINCASVSCPSLSNIIFTPRAIGLQMNKLVINSLKNPLHIRLDGGDLQMTKLLDWFADDFKAHPYKSINGFLKKFAPKQLNKKIAGWITYDWKLNNPENIKTAMKNLNVKQLK